MDLFPRALRLHHEGQVAQAAELYRRILVDAPGHADALHFLGVAEHQMGRSERALELMGRALVLSPEHPDLHSNRGNVLKTLGRLDEAEAEYRRTLELRAEDANALSNLGTVLRERGDLEGARQCFEQVITHRPDHLEAYQNLGNVLGYLGRFPEAVEAYRQALRLKPGNAHAYLHLSGLYYAMGRLPEAIEIYQEWLGLDPGNPVPAHLLAACTGTAVPDRAGDAYIRASFDAFAASFDSSLARLQYQAPRLVGEAVASVVGARRDLDLLDAGCGTGLAAPFLRPFARRLVGVDLSEGMLARARARATYDDLLAVELTAFLDSHPAAFDLIVSADTLVYFGDLAPFAGVARAALRGDGILVFTVEHSEEAEYRIHPHGRYSHSEAYVRRILEGAGFEVRAMDPVELRKEAGRWVAGLLVTAATGPGSSSGCS
jgi:predicted TPR repeat methyltransferase